MQNLRGAFSQLNQSAAAPAAAINAGLPQLAPPGLKAIPGAVAAPRETGFTASPKIDLVAKTLEEMADD